jgi:hypothetical protein
MRIRDSGRPGVRNGSGLAIGLAARWRHTNAFTSANALVTLIFKASTRTKTRQTRRSNDRESAEPDAREFDETALAICERAAAQARKIVGHWRL